MLMESVPKSRGEGSLERLCHVIYPYSIFGLVFERDFSRAEKQKLRNGEPCMAEHASSREKRRGVLLS